MKASTQTVPGSRGAEPGLPRLRLGCGALWWSVLELQVLSSGLCVPRQMAFPELVGFQKTENNGSSKMLNVLIQNPC